MPAEIKKLEIPDELRNSLPSDILLGLYFLSLNDNIKNLKFFDFSIIKKVNSFLCNGFHAECTTCPTEILKPIEFLYLFDLGFANEKLIDHYKCNIEALIREVHEVPFKTWCSEEKHTIAKNLNALKYNFKTLFFDPKDLQKTIHKSSDISLIFCKNEAKKCVLAIYISNSIFEKLLIRHVQKNFVYISNQDIFKYTEIFNFVHSIVHNYILYLISLKIREILYNFSLHINELTWIGLYTIPIQVKSNGIIHTDLCRDTAKKSITINLATNSLYLYNITNRRNFSFFANINPEKGAINHTLASIKSLNNNIAKFDILFKIDLKEDSKYE